MSGTRIIYEREKGAMIRDVRDTLIEQQAERIKALEVKLLDREGLVCGDCDGTGWQENRVEGRYACTCMTEAEPYQILQARLIEAEQMYYRDIEEGRRQIAATRLTPPESAG